MSLTMGYKTRSANGLSGRVTYSKKILQNMKAMLSYFARFS